MTSTGAASHTPQRVMLLGATGAIGRATARALLEDGHEVICFVRPGAEGLPEGAGLRIGQVTDARSLRGHGFRGERFDVLVSCLASRSGAPEDAWAIDHAAHVTALAEARRAGVRHVVLLSAICVQKPKLAFQHAKLAFETELIESGLAHSIVRPTAYFKSLSGQISRVRKGKPFLLFGDGRLTATKPISDADLGRYLALCLRDPSLRGILPIGGPGPAITPREQGEWLFALLGQEPRFRQVPVAMLDAIIATLSALGRLSPRLRAKAELARIGRYYATESMLVWDETRGCYDADATPSFGSDTLRGHYAAIAAGAAEQDLGAHRVF
ncbi:MAG: NAD(P)H-binding protein [Aestuariivirga sp.]|uniref:NAD(P)H-binding protein n=1 Tax=Aestuariivirga sp. TaxID=2650926 RepID=UPI0025C31211|nr:NAD(P)H-binding protein [Aestuariivirga sp.]MCA3561108.1 NAD(P)H-binding protein [Aestuariivirga sp.]